MNEKDEIEKNKNYDKLILEDTQENVQMESDIKLSNEYDPKILNNSVLKLLSIFLTCQVLTLGMEISVIWGFSDTQKNYFFSEFWWIVIPVSIIIFGLVIYGYFNRKTLLSHSKYFVFLFFFYIIPLFFLIVILSLKIPYVTFSATILLSVGIFIVFIFYLIHGFTNILIKLTIVFLYCILHFLIHLTYNTKFYVEFFTLLVCCVFLLAYLTSGVKKLFIEYLTEKEKQTDIKTDYIPFSVIMIFFLIIPMDLIMSPFR